MLWRQKETDEGMTTYQENWLGDSWDVDVMVKGYRFSHSGKHRVDVLRKVISKMDDFRDEMAERRKTLSAKLEWVERKSREDIPG